MFRLLRRIRRRLLKDGSLGKYFLYALGEIALVVIGILIALYLNDIRDFRQERRQELAYLESFQRDLERNVAELDRVIEKSGNVYRDADALIQVVAGAADEVRSDTVADFLSGIHGYTVFLGFDGTLEDLLGSGNLAVIRNDSIRVALATWKSELGLLRELESLGKDSFRELSSHMTRTLPMVQMIVSNPVDDGDMVDILLEDNQFLGLVASHARSMAGLHERYIEKRPHWERLERIVAQEISQLR